MADTADVAAVAAAMLTDPAPGIQAAQAALTGTGSAACTDCGDPIPLDRRKAYPAATRCTFCQADHEERR